MLTADNSHIRYNCSWWRLYKYTSPEWSGIIYLSCPRINPTRCWLSIDYPWRWFWIFSMFKPKKSRDFRLIHMSLDSLKQEIKMCVPCWLSIPNPLLWTDLLIYRLKEVSSHTISPYLEPFPSRHTHKEDSIRNIFNIKSFLSIKKFAFSKLTLK